MNINWNVVANTALGMAAGSALVVLVVTPLLAKLKTQQQGGS